MSDNPKEILGKIQSNRGNLSPAEIRWLFDRILQLEEALERISGLYESNFDLTFELSYWLLNRTHIDCARQLAINAILSYGALLESPSPSKPAEPPNLQ